MSLIRKCARLITLPIFNRNRRKEARAKVEAFLHKFLRTEFYRCQLVYERIYNLNIKQNKRYHLISLGQNCFIRMTCTFWGLKIRKADGERTMPFDISIHPLNTVLKLLQTQFHGYFNDIEYDQKEQCWKNTKLNIQWVHDKENNKEEFIERYKQRIQAINDAIQDNIPCLFFAYQDTEPEAEEINQLYMVLSRLCSHKKFKLVYMIFNHLPPRGINKEIAVYSSTYPEGYIHMDKYTKYTTQGLSFELPVVEFVRSQIEQLILQG